MTTVSFSQGVLFFVSCVVGIVRLRILHYHFPFFVSCFSSYLTLSLLLLCLLFLASLFRSANKRLRKDSSNGMTKVYRYDKNIMPPITPGPNDPDFASPKGYQFQLSNVRTTLFSSRMFLLFQLYHYCSTVFILLTIEIYTHNNVCIL